MNRMFIFCLVAACVCRAHAGSDHGYFVKTEIGTLSEASFLRQAMATSEISSIENFPSIPGLHFMHLKPSVELNEAVKMKLAGLSGVRYVELSQTRHVTSSGFKAGSASSGPKEIPKPIEKPASPSGWKNDPKRASNYATYMSRATVVWKNYTIGSPDIIIADIDTGIDYNHTDLASNIWRNAGEMGKDAQGRDKRSNGIDDDGNGYIDDYIGYNFGDNNNLPWDDYGHGTHTAGIAAAVGGNGYGTSGVCPRCTIMPLRFITATGSGTDADAVRAIDYAIRMGARILNCSWGGKENSQALYDAFKAADDHGIISVVAAGNDGEDLNNHAFYPARYNLPNQLTVAALYAVNVFIPYWSNYGNSFVHLSQAGSEVVSTVPGNRFEAYSGTSMATPGISGSVGLIWSYRPDLTPVQVKKLLSKHIFGDRDSMSKVKFRGRPDLQSLFKEL